jgi:GPH family glycoside/pentoside/hexuronide:cation symporter
MIQENNSQEIGQGLTQFPPFGTRDKLAYAAGDFGCNMSFALGGTFFTLFYTQYIGIPSLMFAGILVILKIWDAINDPLIGFLIDGSKPRAKGIYSGKFKRFIFIGSIALVFASALTFIPIPNADLWTKITVCILGYMIWDISYTVANVPYGSMAAAITADPVERSQLSMWRTLGAFFAAVPIMIILPVILYDENDNLIGGRLFWVALILGIIGFFAFQFCIRSSVERVSLHPSPMKSAEFEQNTPQEESSEPKFNYLNALKNFFTNRGALGITFAICAYFLGVYGGFTASAVMFQAYFKNIQISGAIQFLSMLPMFFVMPFVKSIVKKYGKKTPSEFGLLLSILGGILMLVLPIPPTPTGMMVMMLCNIIFGLGTGVLMSVSYAMVSDSIDYGEWKTGVRREGTIYSIHSFFRKAAQGLGPAMVLVLMVWLGYDESLEAAQTAQTALNMRYLVAALTLFTAVLSWLCIKFVYDIDRKMLKEIEKGLGRNIDNTNVNNVFEE